MFIIFWKLKKNCFFCVSDTYAWIHVFSEAATKSRPKRQIIFNIDVDVLQKLANAYSSTKEKFLLK